MWIFFVSNTKNLTLEIKKYLDFPLTPLEEDFDNAQAMLDLEKRCGKCFNLYTDR
jgi:hypothetical protein